MYTFSELLKKIRERTQLTQVQLALILEVSEVLITSLETNQKGVSKKFISTLAAKMEVSPSSLTPFMFTIDPELGTTFFDRQLIKIGEKLQIELIEKKSANLLKHIDFNVPQNSDSK